MDDVPDGHRALLTCGEPVSKSRVTLPRAEFCGFRREHLVFALQSREARVEFGRAAGFFGFRALDLERLHFRADAADLALLDILDGTAPGVHFIDQLREPRGECGIGRCDLFPALRLEEKREADGVAILHPLDGEDVAGILDLRDIRGVDIFETQPICVAISEKKLPLRRFGLLARARLLFHDLAADHAAVIDPVFCVRLERDHGDILRPENGDALRQDHPKEKDNHDQPDGQAHGGEPDVMLAFGANDGASRGRAHQTVLNLSRRRCRMISATVLTANVMRNRTIAPRNSVR